MPIGEMARLTGVAASALRYYERLGLISPAGRTGLRRRYEESSAERVAMIRLCQDAGFTLAETGRLLAAWGSGRRGWAQLAERKIKELDARIADAQRAKDLVEHALDCPHRDILTCPRFRSALQAQLETPTSADNASLNGDPVEGDWRTIPCGGGGRCDYPRAITIPRDHYFMIGDNRPGSDDSRFWGPVPRDWIIGQAFATYWPPQRVGSL